MAVGGHGYDHGFGPYQTALTPYRSQLERDDSKVGGSGRSLYILLLCAFYQFFRSPSFTTMPDRQFVMPLYPSGTRCHQ
jgi:hypothetical protein